MKEPGLKQEFQHPQTSPLATLLYSLEMNSVWFLQVCVFGHVDVDILTQRCQTDMLTVPQLLLSNLNPLPCFHVITLAKGWTQNGEMLLHVGSLPPPLYIR